MDNYEFDRYVTNKESLLTTINMYGVAIIPNVLNNEECNEMVNGIWDYFEYITQKWDIPIKRNDKNSWREIYKLYPLHSMLFQYFNCGHIQAAWNIRQNKKILDIFSYVWKCKNEDLLVSFDGFSFCLPPEITRRGWNRDNTWYHTDQSYVGNDLETIQSWVTGIDIDKGDATLSFLEKSNNFHKDFKNKFNITDKDNWYKLTKIQEQFYIDKGCSIKNICCPKGSLVLWDSRTIHCGVEPFKRRKNPKLRSIIYLCYLPRNLSDKKNIEKKKKAFNELRNSTHNPAKITLFPKNPRTYGNEIEEITQINPPILSSIGYKLAGF